MSSRDLTGLVRGVRLDLPRGGGVRGGGRLARRTPAAVHRRARHRRRRRARDVVPAAGREPSAATPEAARSGRARRLLAEGRFELQESLAASRRAGRRGRSGPGGCVRADHRATSGRRAPHRARGRAGTAPKLRPACRCDRSPPARRVPRPASLASRASVHLVDPPLGVGDERGDHPPRQGARRSRTASRSKAAASTSTRGPSRVAGASSETAGPGRPPACPRAGSHRARASSSAPARIGFTIRSSMPASSMRARSAGSPLPVSATIGTGGRCRLPPRAAGSRGRSPGRRARASSRRGARARTARPASRASASWPPAADDASSLAAREQAHDDPPVVGVVVGDQHLRASGGLHGETVPGRIGRAPPPKRGCRDAGGRSSSGRRLGRSPADLSVRSRAMTTTLRAADGRDATTTRSRRASPDRRLVARRQLPVGRPDLPARQPAAARAAAPRARQAAAARPLGHDARASTSSTRT